MLQYNATVSCGKRNRDLPPVSESALNGMAICTISDIIHRICLPFKNIAFQKNVFILPLKIFSEKI
jgi:hypothetical protein